MKNPKLLPYQTLPPDDASVWRYMSLAKFISLLSKRSVFLCRADIFEDHFEGSFTEGSIREHLGDLDTESPDSIVPLARWVPCRSFVSCWHSSSSESAALWKIYAGNEGAVAVRSSVGALKRAFPEILDVKDDFIINQSIGKVQYIDYRSEHPYLNDVAGPLFYKRKAFSFEEEIRVVRQELPTVAKPRPDAPDGRAINLGAGKGKAGLSIDVDLSALIEGVYLPPASPRWLRPAVQATLGAFGLDEKACHQSSLDELPEFSLRDLYE